jgi:hypothetical protein
MINREVKTSAEEQAWVSPLISTYNIYHYHLLPRCFSIVLQSLLLPSSSPAITLPGKKTPYKVWFGRKPQWINPDYLSTELVSVNEDLLYIDNEEFGDDPVLTEIEWRVAEYNRQIQAQMVKQSQAYRVITEFEDGDIVTLVIPPKMHLKTESKHLPVWILLGDYGQYKVMS